MLCSAFEEVMACSRDWQNTGKIKMSGCSTLADIVCHIQEKFCIKMGNDRNPKVHEKTVTGLGKWYRAELKPGRA